MTTPQSATHTADRSPERTGPADRRLGERRLQLVPVDSDRRANGDRRQPVSRRESVSGHIRNAIQVLESALVVARRDGLAAEEDTLVAALGGVRAALREADRLAGDRDQLGQLLRVSERGLTPEALPGLREWLA